MKKCYLHIGTEKTATTMIQTFLHLNREKLKNYNYLYTQSAGKINNLKLALSAYKHDRRDELTQINQIKDSNDLEQFSKTVQHNIAKELADLGSNGTVIFSSEHIHARLTTYQELESLKTILHRFGLDDIHVIVYLRRPADIVASLHSTEVKNGLTSNVAPLPTAPYYKNACDHKATIERFQQVFGEAYVTPRLFGKSEFLGGNILNDFMSAIEIPAPLDEFIIPDSQNKILSALGIELLSRVNKEIPFQSETGKLNPERKGLVEFFEENFNQPPKYRIPISLYSMYENSFSESNEWVREKYFPDRESLFLKKDFKGNIGLDFSPENLDAIANVIASLWMDSFNARVKGKKSILYKIIEKLKQ